MRKLDIAVVDKEVPVGEEFKLIVYNFPDEDDELRAADLRDLAGQLSEIADKMDAERQQRIDWQSEYDSLIDDYKSLVNRTVEHADPENQQAMLGLLTGLREMTVARSYSMGGDTAEEREIVAVFDAAEAQIKGEAVE